MKLFDVEVADNVPYALRIFGTYFLILAIGAICLVSRPKKEIEPDEFKSDYVSTGD